MVLSLFHLLLWAYHQQFKLEFIQTIWLGLGLSIQFHQRFKLASIIYRDTTLEIWNDLKERFFQGMGQRSITYKKKLQSFIKVRFLSHIFSLNWRFCWINCKTLVPFQCVLVENMFAMWIKGLIICKLKIWDEVLMGLNKSFTQVKTQILLMNPLHPTNTKNIQSKIVQVILRDLKVH